MKNLIFIIGLVSMMSLTLRAENFTGKIEGVITTWNNLDYDTYEVLVKAQRVKHSQYTQIYKTRVSSDGSYAIHEVEPGQYYVTVGRGNPAQVIGRKVEVLEGVERAFQKLDVTEGISKLSVHLKEPATIEGKVLYTGPGEHLSLIFIPQPMRSIGGLRDPDDYSPYEVYLNSDMEFYITDLPAGEYGVLLNHCFFSTIAITNLVVKGGGVQSINNLNVEYNRPSGPGSVIGRVLNSNAPPLAVLKGMDPNNIMYAHSVNISHGSFSFDDVPLGFYTISIGDTPLKAFLSNQGKSIDLTAKNEDIEIDF